MPEDERTKLRRECQEDLDALRGAVDERQWVLLEKVLARLTRIELGTFSPSEAPTRPEAPRGLTPAYPIPAVLDPKEAEPVGRAALKQTHRRFDSAEKWSADAVKEIFEKANKDPEK